MRWRPIARCELRLRHAQFFGRFERRCNVAGFSLARLHATTPAHHVLPHEHEDGHFILVLAGRYRSNAAPKDSLAPVICCGTRRARITRIASAVPEGAF